MEILKIKRLPRHIAIIPDGNRRWAVDNSLEKQEGYDHGISPGLQVYEECLKLGVEELTFFGFTKDNTKRPEKQKKAFIDACIKSVFELLKRDADLLVVGDTDSDIFPKELLPYTKRTKIGKGKIKVNFLVNYGWEWDLNYGHNHSSKEERLIDNIASKDISRIDLLIHWGARRRLSGMLPVQSVYSDIYIEDEMWPNYRREHLYKALQWYQKQDITLGG